MKKLRFISMMCLLALFVVSLVGCKKEETCNCNNNGNTENPGGGGSGGSGSAQTGYVDLGLPSGTKWKASNETTGFANVFYTYDEAVSTFGDKLPTKEQFEELRGRCSWEWQDNGFKVTGASGNSIFLPAVGKRFCSSGDVSYMGVIGWYWSSTVGNHSSLAWCLKFQSGSMSMEDEDICNGHAVRLVQD